MNNYKPSLTIRYKQGYIYSAIIDGHEVVKYQVDPYAYVQYCKSIRAAQLAISKHNVKLKRKVK